MAEERVPGVMRRALAPGVTMTLLALLAGCAHDARTAGSRLDDQLIAWRTAGTLRADPVLREQTHIAVTSVNGIVLVTGEAPTEPLRDQAIARIATVSGIRQIHNEVRITAPASLAARSRDAWIGNQARARIAATDGISSRVQVVADNASVYLLGLVRQSEGSAATEAVTKVSGVERVVQLFEYLN